MSILRKIRTVLRGDIAFYDLAREVLRRRQAARRRSVERRELERINDSPARLSAGFARIDSGNLLTHFRTRRESFFWASAELERGGRLQSKLFREESQRLIEQARQITDDSTWELAGLGELRFDADNFWRRDPFTGKDWGLEYHADVVLYEGDGADIRILWELNRFGHAVTLALAYAITRDEMYAETFFSHIESWMAQNPYGRGANWNCAMEVALRSINLLAAFDIFRHSVGLSAERLAQILRLFDQHGRFILDNNEFSFIATSNHYLSDVVGLFWIGTLLPELEHAAKWKEFGLGEMLREMDKQVLADGADFEASTGYHRFVTEMLLYSFLLAKRNGVEVADKYWSKLKLMLEYIWEIRRPDGRVPLIGDADGSQIVPIVKRDADDPDYLLDLCAVVFEEPKFKTSSVPEPEVLWILGETGPDTFRSLGAIAEPPRRTAFPDAGAYVLREGDLYLHFNANDSGVRGRGSHGHNDALSIEVSAYGIPFIVDPGSYVYNLDREARQLFRSTAYHSTLEIDGVEQNSTSVSTPFIMGNEASPRVLYRETNDKHDIVSADHFGYDRLPEPVAHLRKVYFNKDEIYWGIEDILAGKGTHDLRFRFHFADGLEVFMPQPSVVSARDKISKTELRVFALDTDEDPIFESQFVSRNYGSRAASQSACWMLRAAVPCTFRWLILPLSYRRMDER